MSQPVKTGAEVVPMNFNLESLRNKAVESLETILPSPQQQKRTFSFAELNEIKDVEQRFIIPDLLPAYAVAVFIGEDGIGKTQICTQLALSIAFRRKKFLNRDLNVEHGSALIVATEDSRQKWIKAAARQAYCLNPELNPADVSIDFTEASIFDDFIAFKDEMEKQLQEKKRDLVVVDALSDLFTLIDGEINSNSHARKLLSFFQLMCDTYQTTIIIIHHAAKSKIVAKQKENKIFVEKGDSQGAGAITQKPRTVLALSNDPRSISPEGQFYTNYLHVVKANLMGKTFMQQAIRLEFNSRNLLHMETGFVDIQMMQQTAAPTQAPEGENLKRKLLPSEITSEKHHETLQIIFRDSDTIARGECIDKMAVHYEVGKTKIESALDRGGFLAYLMQNGFIQKTSTGFKYLRPRAPQAEQESFF